MCKGSGGRNLFTICQFSCMIKLPPYLEILLFGFLFQFLQGFMIYILLYIISVADYRETNFHITEFADLSGTLFHDQTGTFHQRTSLQLFFITN